MATNHDRVGKALELLTSGLKPFVERELKSAWGEHLVENTRALLSDTRLQARAADGSPLLDVAALLVIMDREWKTIFSQTLGKAERSMVNEVLDVRNKWAHQRPFSTDDAYRALDSVCRLLGSISAAAEADEVEKVKQELLRLKFDEQVRSEKRRSASTPLEGQPVGHLKP
jgi:hypothetical protein